MATLKEECELPLEKQIEDTGAFTVFYLVRESERSPWQPARYELTASSAQQAQDFFRLELVEANNGTFPPFAYFRYVAMVRGDAADEQDGTQPSSDVFSVFFAHNDTGEGDPNAHRWCWYLGEQDNVRSGREAAAFVRRECPTALIAAVLAHQVPVLDYLADPTWCTLDGEPSAPPIAEEQRHTGWLGHLRRRR